MWPPRAFYRPREPLLLFQLTDGLSPGAPFCISLGRPASVEKPSHTLVPLELKENN